MKVLSLFDGISVAFHALTSLGVNISSYYSSEICTDAQKVSFFNYGDRITQLGDIRNLNRENLPTPVDILIAGFPCQSFSNSGKRLGFNDERGKLFWELQRILELMKPEFFLLENSSGMGLEDRKLISEAIGGFEPVLINSSAVSAQERKRLYFSNYPIVQPADAHILIRDIIQPATDDEWKNLNSYGAKLKNRIVRNIRTVDQKALTICCNSRSVGSNGGTVLRNERDGNLVRVLNRNELELLQGLPVGYTKPVPKTVAVKLLGNSFNSPTIAHIFSEYLANRKIVV